MGASCCSDISKAEIRDQAAGAVAMAPVPAGVSVMPVGNGLLPASAAAQTNEGEEDERFVSTVPELPTFNNAPKHHEDGNSESGDSMGVSEMYDSMTIKEQQKQ